MRLLWDQRRLWRVRLASVTVRLFLFAFWVLGSQRFRVRLPVWLPSGGLVGRARLRFHGNATEVSFGQYTRNLSLANYGSEALHCLRFTETSS